MVEIRGVYKVAAARLSTNKGKASAIVTFARKGEPIVKLTCRPCDGLDLALEAWKNGWSVQIIGSAAECSDKTLLLANEHAIRSVV